MAFPLCWFAALLFICSLLGESGQTDVNPNTNKINGIFFCIMLFTVVGMVCLFSGLQRLKWKQIAAAVLAGLYVIFFVRFTEFYFCEFSPSYYWNSTCGEVLAYIDADEALSQKALILNTAGTYSGYIYYLAAALPSPYEIDVENKDYGDVITTNERDQLREAMLETYGFGASYIVLDLYDENAANGEEGLAEEALAYGFELIDFGRWTLICYR